MPDLYITPTRWDLLRAMEAGNVANLIGGIADMERGVRVGARVKELWRHGLARLDSSTFHYWATERGLKAIADHTCTTCRGYTPSAPTCGTCKGRADS